jgi:hypothetical protein
MRTRNATSRRTQMRKITKEACDAFMTGRKYCNDNTTVYESSHDGAWYLQEFKSTLRSTFYT